jgi:hypothetical protein
MPYSSVAWSPDYEPELVNNFYLAISCFPAPGYCSPGMYGQEVMSQNSAGLLTGATTAGMGRQPGEIYHTLSWDELDGCQFLFGGTNIIFQPAANPAEANLVFKASATDPLTGLPFNPDTVCEGIPYGLPNASGGVTIQNATITFDTRSQCPIGFESAGFNLDIQTSLNGPNISDVTLSLAGTENTTLAGPSFDNSAPVNNNPDYVFQNVAVSYLGSPTASLFPGPNDSVKDSIGVTWSGPANPIPAGTLLHVGVTPDVWDWTDYKLTATINGGATPIPAMPVHVWSSAQFYGLSAGASLPSQRISASCMTTIGVIPTQGVRGLAVTSPMDSTVVCNLQIADVTGMGLALSNLNGITLAQLQQSNQLIAVSNFGTNVLNSGQQFVVILEGSASDLPAEIATNGHYVYLNQSNLVDRELFAVLTSSNGGFLVHSFSLLNSPPIVATFLTVIPSITAPP